MGQAIHRQRQSIMITIWAPDPARRTSIASLIDVEMKKNYRFTLPDTSQATMTYEKTNQIDDHQTVSVYRRDLIYAVEYATIETFTAYEVTAVLSTIITPS